MKSMEKLEDEDLKFALKGNPSSPKDYQSGDRLDYQAFVKLFMPVTDKRFTTLIIQRSEKANKVPVMTVSTQQLAIQLIKSTAVYRKYQSMLDEHRVTSPQLSPVAGASPELFIPGINEINNNLIAQEQAINSEQTKEQQDEPDFEDALDQSAIEIFAGKDIDVSRMDMTASIDSSRPRAHVDDSFLRSKTTEKAEPEQKLATIDDSFLR